MSFFDKARKQLTKAVDQHGDKIAQGLDKAGEAVDKKTGGKYSSRITQGTQAGKKALDGLDGRNDDIAGGPTPKDGRATSDGPKHARRRRP